MVGNIIISSSLFRIVNNSENLFDFYAIVIVHVNYSIQKVLLILTRIVIV